jgi:signal transduction histidine kinase
MNAATEFAWTHQPPKTELSFQFENAPVGLAQCQRQGNITALNPALERMLAGRSSVSRPLFLADLIHPQDPSEGRRLLRELFDGSRDSFQIDSSRTDGDPQSERWIVWRVQATNGEPEYALALFESVRPGQLTRDRDAELRLRQAEKLEAVGRLAGGVAHDFNNLLTGVLLYCDLLLANLEPCHRVRKYAQEIRSAGLQATGLVRQLLAVARPTNSEPRLLSLNEIAEGMRNLLVA